MPELDGPITKREILLSKLIGIPYEYNVVSKNGIITCYRDVYRNEIRKPETEKEKLSAYVFDIGSRKRENKERIFQKIVKEALMSGDDELGIARKKFDYSDDTSKEENFIVMSKKLFELGSMFGIGFVPEIHAGYQYEHTYHSRMVFEDIENCTEEQKELIQNKKEKIYDFKEKVRKSKSGKYDKKGIIKFPIYPKYLVVIDYLNENIPSSHFGINQESEIVIEGITLRELAEAGILPEDCNWQKIPKSRLTKNDLANADKEYAITKKEKGGIKGLIDKTKAKFNKREGKE